MTNKYHFSLHLQFKQDCNVNKLEKAFGLPAYKKNMLSESKGKNKTAKLWLKTEDFDDPDTYKILNNFLNKMKDKFKLINEAIKTFDGKATLTLYFEDLHEKPYVKLSCEDMKLLTDNNISFDVDFRI